ncbi:MAG: hypothetical protein HWD59_10520 [Coxiellaceae bacterium]|nr:MAG: hypothetical protein HWD59_10520 [Coxiellaceae bacterium]
MTTLPQTPVSILQCIRLCFKAIPTVIKNNWLNFVLLSLTSLVPSFALTGKTFLE